MTEGLCKARLKKQGCLSIYGIVTTTKLTLHSLIEMAAMNITISELSTNCSLLQYIKLYRNYCTFK